MSDNPFHMFEDLEPAWREREEVLSDKPPMVDVEEEAWATKPRRYKVDGEWKEFYSIGDVAEAIGRQPVTIRLWERQGRLPRADWRTPTPDGEQVPGRPVVGQRLYTRTQVRRIQAAQRHLKKGDWSSFKEELAKDWSVE